jgi:hypothetical protein
MSLIHLYFFGRQVNVKIFLAAYMIAAHPNHVFEGIEELEQKVIEASEPMLACFQKVRSWSQSHGRDICIMTRF